MGATGIMQQAASSLGVSDEDFPAFSDYYKAITQRNMALAQKQSMLADWRQALCEARAPSVVDAFIAKHRKRIDEAAKAACEANPATSIPSERLLRFAESRLKVCGVYGVAGGTTLDEALERVVREMYEITAAAPIRAVKLEHAEFDDAHVDIRNKAYPYRSY